MKKPAVPRTTFTVAGLRRMLGAVDDKYTVAIVGKKGEEFEIDAIVIGTDGSVAIAISPKTKVKP